MTLSTRPVVGGSVIGASDKPISQRGPLLNGRSVTLLTNHISKLQQKVDQAAHNAVNNSCFEGLGCVITNQLVFGSLSIASMHWSWSTSSGDQILGAVAGGASIVTGPMLIYSCYNYWVQMKNASCWKEKIQELDIIKRIIRVQPGRNSLDPDVVRAVLLHRSNPKSLKRKIILKSSLEQLFHAARGLSKNDVQDYFHSYLSESDQATLNFMLYPQEYREYELFRGVNQFKWTLVNHGSLLNHFLETVPLFWSSDNGRALLIEIVQMREEQGFAFDKYSELLEPIISKQVNVIVGESVVSVSQRRLCEYPRFAVYFASRGFQMAAPEVDEIGQVELNLPISEGHDEKSLVLILQYIETGNIPEILENPIEFLKQAEYYGVRELVLICTASILAEIESRASGMTKVETAGMFELILEVFPEESMPTELGKAITKQFSNAAKNEILSAARFWLEFIRRVSPARLFCELDFLPSKFSIEFVDLIQQIKPPVLLKKLNEALKHHCIISDNPIQFLQTCQQYPELCFEIGKAVLDLPNKGWIVSLWDLAFRMDNRELKEEIKIRIMENQALKEYWPRLQLPDELI